MRAQTFIHPLIQPADCPMTESPLLAPPPPAPPPLRFAVRGAGAVGCYFGALLARAGHAVTLIGRPAHVLAVRDHGLRLQTAAMDVQVPLAASTEAGAARYGPSWCSTAPTTRCRHCRSSPMVRWCRCPA